MMIHFNDEQSENTHLGIDRSFASDSNVTHPSEVHLQKQEGPRISTERGIEIDLNDEQLSNANSPI
jgi:hypothetical protein